MNATLRECRSSFAISKVALRLIAAYWLSRRPAAAGRCACRTAADDIVGYRAVIYAAGERTCF
jgi:hypothetical protein